LLEQGYNAEALREFREVSYIDPKWVLPYLQQGFIYIQMQDYVNAEQAARTAIRIDFTQQPSHLILAIALFNQHKNGEALKYMESALQMTPDDGVAKFYKALILRDLGEYDAALIILQQLLGSSNDPLQISRITAEIESLQDPLSITH
jgi:tetratricopeptide (TPR) repeat protein